MARRCGHPETKQRFEARPTEAPGALCIQLVHGLVDRPIKCVSVSEGLMGQMDGLDVVQFRGILGQPLGSEPMRTGGKRCQRELAGVDRTIVLDQHHPLGELPGLGP
jgi:hypothetical protein